MKTQQRGYLMIDVASFHLTDDERYRLCDPRVGGVILFRRNFESIEQLKSLVQEIKSLRQPELIIAVDHEGGRVQRFIAGFTRLPAMANLGQIANQQGIQAACIMAEKTGRILASELRACGIDLSFTPVLDLDYGRCAVIGNRSFHRQPENVELLAKSLQKGLHQGGMIACGKHFPGHGFVSGDSHTVLPCDERSWEEIQANDLKPFAYMVQNGMQAVMPAHVVYPKIDEQPAGFSAFWLKKILREQMGFQGAIFSDDLTMEGACCAGGIVERVQLSLQAGCDIALICNRPDLVDEYLSFRQPENSFEPHLAERWEKIAGKGRAEDFAQWLQTDEAQQMQQEVALLAQASDLTPCAPKVGE